MSQDALWGKPPTNAELEVLFVLWKVPSGSALKLGDIHEEVGAFRKTHGQESPALTTVSTTLRGALAKGLLKEVRLVDGKVHAAPAPGRGLVTTRSPQTAYQTAVSAVEVLHPLVEQLVSLCPQDERTILVERLVQLCLPEQQLDLRERIRGNGIGNV